MSSVEIALTVLSLCVTFLLGVIVGKHIVYNRIINHANREETIFVGPHMVTFMTVSRYRELLIAEMIVQRQSERKSA